MHLMIIASQKLDGSLAIDSAQYTTIIILVVATRAVLICRRQQHFLRSGEPCWVVSSVVAVCRRERENEKIFIATTRNLPPCSKFKAETPKI